MDQKIEKSDDVIDGIHRDPSAPHSQCPAIYRPAVLDWDGLGLCVCGWWEIFRKRKNFYEKHCLLWHAAKGNATGSLDRLSRAACFTSPRSKKRADANYSPPSGTAAARLEVRLSDSQIQDVLTYVKSLIDW